MRLVHVSVPAGKREAILRTLDEQGVDYVVTDETSGRKVTAVVSFPLPTDGVEPVLDSLRDAGVGEDAFTVVVEAQTVVSEHFEELSERFAEADEAPERIARQELLVRAKELAPDSRNYAVLTVLSVVVATAGLLLDSPATVVGSMVIAPLIGPAMATSVGTVVNDRDLFVRGVRLQVLGFVLAIVTATVFALLVRYLRLVPPELSLVQLDEISERVAPGFLTLPIAVGAGVAGALSLRTGVSAALVGVMIAVALVPPAAVVGIGIAWLKPMVALGSSVLVLVNALSINLAALVTFWYSGYRPEHWFRHDRARSTMVKRVASLGVAVLVLSAFLGGVTFASVQASTTDAKVTDEVEAVVEEYPQLTLLNVVVHHGQNPLVREPERVVVTVGYEPDTDLPELAAILEGRIARFYDPSSERFVDRDGDRITVQVRFIAYQETADGVPQDTQAESRSSMGRGDVPEMTQTPV